MHRAHLVLICAFLLILLSLRFFSFFATQSQYSDGQEVTFTTTLLNEPQVYNKSQRITAQLSNGQTIFVTTSRFPEYSYAQTLQISGPIRVLPRARPAQREAHEGRPYGTSTEQSEVLNNNSVILTMSFPKIEAEKNDKNFALAITSSFRQKVITLFEQTLPPTSSSLLLGIVFGIKSQMPAAFKDDLRLAGVLHVVAASGMNVTLVASFLSGVLTLFLRRQVALVITLVGILFYALMSGFEASIVRASIMGSLAFTAQLFGRQYLALLGLLLAAYLMLFISPTTLFDVGFQLSFAATLGLLFFSGVARSRSAGLIPEDFKTTVSAQIATLPILLSTFGIYSLWSPIANLLLLWTVPILMVLGGIGAIVGSIIPLFGKLILYLTIPLLWYFERIVGFFANLGGLVELNNFPWQLSVGYYALLFAALIYFYSKK